MHASQPRRRLALERAFEQSALAARIAIPIKVAVEDVNLWIGDVSTATICANAQECLSTEGAP